MAGVILVISGPSGSGKSSVLKRVLKKHKNTYFSISSTSRQPRVGEKNGVDYNFISKEEFEIGIKNDEFLEWALVHGNYYGTSLKAIQNAYKQGKIVVLDIDVQGHEIVRKKMGDLITSIFITTQNDKVLKRRLTNRQTDDIDIVNRRVFNAKKEMQSIDKYDYLIINNKLKKVVKEFNSILKASKHKVANIDLQKFNLQWNTL